MQFHDAFPTSLLENGMDCDCTWHFANQPFVKIGPVMASRIRKLLHSKRFNEVASIGRLLVGQRDVMPAQKQQRYQ